jgi:hypothetical protein
VVIVGGSVIISNEIKEVFDVTKKDSEFKITLEV